MEYREVPFAYVPRAMAAREHSLAAKPTPNDWLGLDKDGKPVLFAAADEVPEGIELCEPLEDGEVVPFIALRRHMLAEIEIARDGSYWIPGEPPAGVNWFQLHEGCGANSIERLVALMGEENAIGTSIIEYVQRAEVGCLYNGEKHTLELMDHQFSMLDLLAVEVAGHA